MKQRQKLFFIFPLLFACTLNKSDKKRAGVDADWTHDSTEHFQLHAQKEARSKNSLGAVGQKLEAIQLELLRTLNETNRQQLDVYFLKDRETLAAYTGFPANGYTNTAKGFIYYVDKAPFHLALRHETMHALSWRLWGPPQGYWLSEGMAVFASGGCGGYDLHTLAHAISKQNKVMPFYTLEQDFDFRSIEPSLQSASLVQYIYDKYGVNAVKGFWQKGWRNAKSVVGVSASELEKEWKKFVDNEKYDAVIDWGAIKESGCE